MELLDGFYEKARKNRMRVVLPEGNDERIVTAASKALGMGIAQPILIGKPDEVRAVAKKSGISLDGITIVSNEDEAFVARYAENYAAARDVRVAVARKLVGKPLSFGAMMVKTGDADAMVGGIASATASVIQATSVTVGYQKGISTPSSIFVMIIPEFLGEKNKALVFADCAVTVSPNARQLAEIGVVSGRNAKALLGMEPKIAFLSFATKGSANHADVDKVREAVRYAREIEPSFAIDGELQGDAALVPRVAAKKVKESDVAGKANVLVFPDLDAGNICYKLVQYLANAKALGPILQGFAKAVNDLSRGATADDVVGVMAITAVQAQNLNRQALS